MRIVKAFSFAERDLNVLRLFEHLCARRNVTQSEQVVRLLTKWCLEEAQKQGVNIPPATISRLEASSFVLRNKWKTEFVDQEKKAGRIK